MSELHPETQRRHQALAVTTAFLALFSIVGFALYGLPRFYPFFVEDLGWTRQQVTSGNAYSKIGIALAFGFLAGRLVDAFGPRRIMIVGILIAGGALIGLSEVKGLSAFYFFYCVNALGYVCGGPLPNQVMLSRWFSAARGKAMGLAYLGIGVGGALVPLVANRLTIAFGWRGALKILGLLMILVALPAALWVREPPRAESTGGPGPAAASLAEVLRGRAFYLLALGSMASIGAVGGTIQNLALYLRLDRKLPQAEVDSTLAWILAASIVGRLLMGWLADKWARKRVMILIYVIVAGSIPLIALAPNGAPLRAAAILFGIGLGGDYMIIPLMAADLFGLALMGRVMGIVLTADGVAEAMVPMAVATTRDLSGSYDSGFFILVALAAVGALAVSLLPARQAAPQES